MKDDRLTKKMLKWDWSHKGRTWSWAVRSILKNTGQHNICDIDLAVETPVLDFDSVNTVKYTSTRPLAMARAPKIGREPYQPYSTIWRVSNPNSPSAASEFAVYKEPSASYSGCIFSSNICIISK